MSGQEEPRKLPDEEVLTPLTWAKVWTHHRQLAHAAELLRLLHRRPDWHYHGVYGPSDDFGVVWVYAHEPTAQVWLFGLTPHFRWASDGGDTQLLEGRPQRVPYYTPEGLAALLLELGLPAGEEGDGPLAAEDEERDERDEEGDSLDLLERAGGDAGTPAVQRRSPAEQRAYEARRHRLEELVAQTRPGEMSLYQRRAYEAPIDEAKAGPGSLHPKENCHSEYHGGILVSVVLTADVGRFGMERYGQRGMWHASVAVQAGRPVPVPRWTDAHRAAAGAALGNILRDLGEEASTAVEADRTALHLFRRMSPAERAGLGLP